MTDPGAVSAAAGGGARRAIARETVPVSFGALGRGLGAVLSSKARREATRAELRAALREALGVPHVALVSSARAGLYLLLAPIGRERPGGEVLLDAYNFFAVPQMVRAAGLAPVFVDPSDPQGEVTPDDLAAAIGPRTAAVLVSHHFGRPSRMREIAALARERGIEVVEDCAHAFGARVDGRTVGSFGRGGAFSLSLTKGLVGVAGGVVVSADPEMGAALDALAENSSREGAASDGKRLPETPAAEVIPQLVSAAAGKWILDRRTYPIFTHAISRAASRLGVDLLERLMAEPFSDPLGDPLGDPAPIEPRALHPAFAMVARAHLGTAMGERDLRRTLSLRLLRPDEPRRFCRLSLPEVDADRESSWLAFVVRSAERAALRRHLLDAGFDTREDYLAAMISDPIRFPRATRLTGESLYLPIRSLRTPDEADRLRAALEAFDDGRPWRA